MKRKNYYIVKSGKLRRKKNTVYFISKNTKRSLPVESIDAIYALGEVDLNKKLLVYLSQKKISIHFYNYYGSYAGTFYPREYLNSGSLLVEQVKSYLNHKKRMEIAKKFVRGATSNMLMNLRYYKRRGKDVGKNITKIETEKKQISSSKDTSHLMGIEGRIRQWYYNAFNAFLRRNFKFNKRVRRPPNNKINALLSFGNSLLYGTVLNEIYRTELNPTISYLHEPRESRFSLNLDISEIFKPILVDKVIFRVINKRVIDSEDFVTELNSCLLNEEGKRTFLSEYDKKLKTTLKHKKLKRSVSYKRLIRLECYKLIKHLLGDKEYSPFLMEW